MARTVVLRLVEVGEDPGIRGIAEDVATGRSVRFTTTEQLLQALRTLADRSARDEPAP